MTSHPPTRDAVEAQIQALDLMLDWAERHDLRLAPHHNAWHLAGYDETTAARLLLDGADPGAVEKVEGDACYLVRDFGAGVTVFASLPARERTGRKVTVLNPAGQS